MTAAAKECRGERPEDQPAAALLGREAAEIPVEHERGLKAIEPTPVRDGWFQCLGRNEHGAEE
ncbi:MAG TPA: hypothetical protein VKU61_00155 [Candidatus Binatia bacterium]|nr:hypothetical protein [Candidatus Binatia bacterium]